MWHERLVVEASGCFANQTDGVTFESSRLGPSSMWSTRDFCSVEEFTEIDATPPRT